MAKRFVDTDIWNKEWFQLLTLKQKILVKYIFENCDCAGVWDKNYRLASFVIGEQVSESDVKEINAKHSLFTFFDDKIFVVDFIKFQYGSLSENCKPHKPIIEKLKKYNLYERVLKGFTKGFQTLEEKEKEKEKEIEQEEDKEKEEYKEEKEIKDPFVNPIVSFFKSEYKRIFNSRLYLTMQECNKICELSKEIPNFKQTITEVLPKLKNVDFGFDNWKPTANWLLKDSNYTAVLNGAYDKNEKKTVWDELREKQNE